jgi:hypothetical protein
MGSNYRSATKRLDDVLTEKATPWSEPEEFMKIAVASQLIVIASFVKYSEGVKSGEVPCLGFSNSQDLS